MRYREIIKELDAPAPDDMGFDSLDVEPNQTGNTPDSRPYPISNKLERMLHKSAQQAGVRLGMTSMAQDPADVPRGKRWNSGTVRHDAPHGHGDRDSHELTTGDAYEGGAADVEVIDKATGQKLSVNPPHDKVKELVRASIQNGATGIGAGYMGQWVIHIGYGQPRTVWGKNGFVDAPQWLKDIASEEGLI